MLDTKSTTKDAEVAGFLRRGFWVPASAGMTILTRFFGPQKKFTKVFRRGLTLIDADIILTAEDAEDRGA